MFEWKLVCGARAAVMGIVNVTPDSFSDGGRFLDPGAAPVPADEELRRVIPVVERLAATTSVPISVDTTKAAVARAAIDAGASVVNDVSAGRLDPDILGVAAEAGAGYVVMHMQGEPRTMQAEPHYDDVVAEVGDFLVDRVGAARAAGVPEGAIAADPGIGFGKTVEHNLRLLAGLPAIAERVGVPVMVGASRKTFVGKVLARAGAASGDLPVDQREEGTLATVVWAVERGASIVRVHDVLPAVRAVRLLDALRAAEASAA